MCGLFACVAACVIAFALRPLSLRLALRAFFAFCVTCFLRCGKSRKGKRGATRGKQPWVFSPRVIRADECGRSTHDPRFPSGVLK